MSIRIVGGIYRHRILSLPSDRENIRPTKDRIREAIFSAINFFNGKVILDLYAGSGAMGIEAISRGASKTYFNDINPFSIKCLKENLESLKVPNEKYDISCLNDFSALEKYHHEKLSFDIIFIDPPYKEGQYEKLTSEILFDNLLSKNGILVFESNKKIAFNTSLFSKIKEYKYGDIFVYIAWR